MRKILCRRIVGRRFIAVAERSSATSGHTPRRCATDKRSRLKCAQPTLSGRTRNILVRQHDLRPAKTDLRPARKRSNDPIVKTLNAKTQRGRQEPLREFSPSFSLYAGAIFVRRSHAVGHVSCER